MDECEVRAFLAGLDSLVALTGNPPSPPLRCITQRWVSSGCELSTTGSPESFIPHTSVIHRGHRRFSTTTKYVA